MTVTADLIRMSGTMARSSKTSSSLSPNGRTDSSANCSTSSFTGSLFPPDPSFINIFFLSRRRRDEEVTCYGDLGCFRDEVRVFDLPLSLLLSRLQAKYFRDLSTTLTCCPHPLKRSELSSSCTHNKTGNYTRFETNAKHRSWVDPPAS